LSTAGTTRLCRTTTDEATHNQITTTPGFLRGEDRAVAGGVKAKPLRGDLAVNLDPARDRRCPKPGKNPKKRGVDRPRSFRNVGGLLAPPDLAGVRREPVLHRLARPRPQLDD